MEPSSPEKSDNGRLIDEALAATENDAHPPDGKDAARRMVANRLLAALASGNLEHLERAREAFLHQGQDENLVPSNGKLNTIPKEEAPQSEQDYLRKEEAALRQAELELEQRRAEVQAARKKAEAEADRRRLEEAAQQRARAEEQRLAELEAIRRQAEAATSERARKEQLLNAETEALRKSEQEYLKAIADAELRLRALEEVCRQAGSEKQKRAEREQWLTAEVEGLRKAEEEQLGRIEAIEARVLKQLEARHHAETATRDDNVFRISSGLDPAALGSSSKGDTYSTTSLGFNLDVPVSRQRFQGGVTWNKTRYDRFTILNLDGHQGRGIWLWQVGNDISGQLGYTEALILASLANVQSGLRSSTPNFLTIRRTFLNAEYMLTPRWLLRGEAGRLKLSNEALERQVNNSSTDSVDLTVSYVTPASNQNGLSVRVEDGRLPNRQLVAGDLFDNSYRQQNVAAVTEWTLTGSSHVSARVGWLRRSYAQLPQRDFEGSTFQAAYDWRPTGKLRSRGNEQMPRWQMR